MSLPSRYDTRQWNVVWVGFDVALLGCLAAAGWRGVRRRRPGVLFLVPRGYCCSATPGSTSCSTGPGLVRFYAFPRADLDDATT